MEEISHYLFVYGSLLDEKNKFGTYLKESCQFFQKGKFKGLLFDIGEYPGAVSNAACDSYVYGSIFILDAPGDVLKVLDHYEGFGTEYPQPNEFIRELVEVETSDMLIKCWIYLYNWPVENLAQIKSGRYF